MPRLIDFYELRLPRRLRLLAMTMFSCVSLRAKRSNLVTTCENDYIFDALAAVSNSFSVQFSGLGMLWFRDMPPLSTSHEKSRVFLRSISRIAISPRTSDQKIRFQLIIIRFMDNAFLLALCWSHEVCIQLKSPCVAYISFRATQIAFCGIHATQLKSSVISRSCVNIKIAALRPLP